MQTVNTCNKSGLISNDEFEYSYVDSGLIKTGSDALIDDVAANVNMQKFERAPAEIPTFMKNSHESVYEKSLEFESNQLKRTENVERALYDFIIDEHFSDTDSSSCQSTDE